MFATNIRRIFLTCGNNIRTLRGGRRLEEIPDPGLNRRITALKQKGVVLEDEDAEEFLEDSHSDMYGAEEAYNEHIKETLLKKDVLRYQIVKNKYFKENMPNLLTWSEKEQIRHLASADPEEWTLEKISECFPVTLEVAKKLLKYPWKPATEVRIARHDASAMRNWRLLKEGTLDIPENLREKFLKFSNRTIPPLNKASIKTDITQNHEKMGEFESIVRRCAAKEREEKNNFKQSSETTGKDEKFHEHKSKTGDKRLTTLSELATKIQKRLDKGEELDLPDQLLLETLKSEPAVSSDNLNTAIETFNDPKKEVAVTSPTDDKPTTYPERIRIPKSAYKKGATYKVKDCYYDDDGRFLYRVLGASN